MRLIAANRKCGIAIQNRLLRFLGAQPYPKGGTGPAVVGHLDPTGTYDSPATTINGKPATTINGKPVFGPYPHPV